jgi:hypothetical protein
MSTLRTYNVQSSDSSSTNIQLTENGGIIVAGVSTFSNNLITDGRIGIGTDNPNDSLTILKDATGAGSGGLKLQTAGSNESFLTFGVSSSLSKAIFTSSFNGSGTVLPMVFAVGSSSADERLCITSGGRVGLGSDGVSSPQSVLHVFSNSSTDTIKIQAPTSSGDYDAGFEVLRDTTAGGAKMVAKRNTASGGVGWEWFTTANNTAEVNATYTSRMVLTESGTVGIGTDDPQQTLHVQDSSGRKIYPPPLFRARKDSADTQTLNNGTNTKITYTIEDFDTHGYYNTTNSRFTPTIPGWYFIEATVRCGTGGAGARFDMTLYIDGSASVYAGGQNQTNENDMGTGVATLVYLDGTQYVEVYVNQNSGSNCSVAYNSNAGGGNSINHFSAFLVSPN